LELATYGLIRQRTGEDWDEVQLTLSTAKPALAGSMPELQPWFVRAYEPVLAKEHPAKVEAARGRMELGLMGEEADKRLDAPMASAALPQEAELATADVSTQGPAVTFHLQRPETIPGDWQPRKVPMASASLTAQYGYEATPRLSPYAFLRAKITNTTPGLFLPGEVAVFRDGAFVSTAALPQVAPGETFDLYLGVDERMKVERRQLKDFVQVSLLPGLRGKMRSVDQEYLTIVENFTGATTPIVVFDHHPVSEREEIVVEAIRMQPDATETDPEKPGVFRWARELLPGQKQEFRLSYRVRHPVDLPVQW
jgi:uncharacterized protein (TIGR02231 family)